jgi:hypothetical protein
VRLLAIPRRNRHRRDLSGSGEMVGLDTASLVMSGELLFVMCNYSSRSSPSTILSLKYLSSLYLTPIRNIS